MRFRAREAKGGLPPTGAAGLAGGEPREGIRADAPPPAGDLSVPRPGQCDSREIALKSFFLGPQAENGPWLGEQIRKVMDDWFCWRRGLFPGDGRAVSTSDMEDEEFHGRRAAFGGLLRGLSRRFEQEIPKFSPRYIGHMFSETSLPGLCGHLVALLHNPNNISGESSRVGVAIEDEAIASLLEMVGFSADSGRGHFTSGGTVANLEALTRARARSALWLSHGVMLRRLAGASLSLFECAHLGWDRVDEVPLTSVDAAFDFARGNPWEVGVRLKEAFGHSFRGPVILVPDHKHYSWVKGASLLGLGDEALWRVGLDQRGRLSVPRLRDQLERARRENRPVLMVVSVVGTTELGNIDPVNKVQTLLDRWRTEHGIHIWHHVDGAYGGFFCCLQSSASRLLGHSAASALRAIAAADSITLDPHKLGYVPYASGAFLTRHHRNYSIRGYGAPYVQFDARKDRGPFTIEGSRPATGAASTWMTEKAIGFNPEGYGRILRRTIQVKKDLEKSLLSSGLPILLAPFTDSNILCFFVAPPGGNISQCNAETERVYRAFSPREGSHSFIVSKTSLFRDTYGDYIRRATRSLKIQSDTDHLTLIRLCMMNPFFGSREMKTDFTRLFVDSLASVITGGTPASGAE